MWRKGNPYALLVGMQIGAATVERSIELPQKIKYGPSNSTPGNLSKETRNLIQKNIYTHVFIAKLSTIAKIWKQLKSPSVDE